MLPGAGEAILAALMVRPHARHSPGPALHAAVGSLLREAAEAVEGFGEDPPGNAHFVRTRVKRLQSLSRLVPGGRKWRASFLPPLRELKDLFAPTRDATIIRWLAEKYAPGEVEHLAAPPAPDLARARRLAGEADGVACGYSGWDLVAWGDVVGRAARTYRAARRAWKAAALPAAADADFHRWRRRVKHLLYQCEYLAECAPLARMTRRVDKLGDVLGRIQDICMAEHWLAAQRGLAVPAALPRGKEALRHRALEMGGELFAPKTREFRKTLEEAGATRATESPKIRREGSRARA